MKRTGMMECWNRGMMDKTSKSCTPDSSPIPALLFSIIPAFQHSNIPAFHSSDIPFFPPFHHSILPHS
jgi:hypothetical protein